MHLFPHLYSIVLHMVAHMKDNLFSGFTIFQDRNIEPFQQPKRCSSYFELQFDVCDNNAVIAANICSFSDMYILYG